MRNRKVIVSFALVFAAVFALFYYVLFQLLSAKGGTEARTLYLNQVGIFAEKENADKICEKLEKKKLTYPGSVERLVSAIKEEFMQIGRKSEPHVLCELLEIEDETWRNAAEGYLNTQRFYILVEPESFDIALGIYDRLRREKKVFGVGLINTQNMEQYEEVPEGTLASVVTSKNRYARRYINMVLGKVMLCDRYEDLKKYPVSITRECMRYQNRVASAIKPEIFSVPFIGKQALKVQLELEKKKCDQLSKRISELETRRKAMESVIVPLNTETDVDIKYRLDVITRLHMLQVGIKKCEDNIRTLKKNATLIQKQIQLETLQELLRELQEKINKSNQELGTVRRIKDEKKTKIEQLSGQQVLLQKEVKNLLESAGDVQSFWMKEYETQTTQKSYEQFRDNFDRRRKANETICKNAEKQMIDVMIVYKTEHDFGAAPSMEGYPEYASVYERLRT